MNGVYDVHWVHSRPTTGHPFAGCQSYSTHSCYALALSPNYRCKQSRDNSETTVGSVNGQQLASLLSPINSNAIISAKFSQQSIRRPIFGFCGPIANTFVVRFHSTIVHQFLAKIQVQRLCDCNRDSLLNSNYRILSLTLLALRRVANSLNAISGLSTTLLAHIDHNNRVNQLCSVKKLSSLPIDNSQEVWWDR